jgi:hemin uptake protein HemP
MEPDHSCQATDQKYFGRKLHRVITKMRWNAVLWRTVLCSLSLHVWDYELLELFRVNDAIDVFLSEERRSSSSTRNTGALFVRHDGALYRMLNRNE